MGPVIENSSVYWIEQLRVETDPVSEMCSTQNTGWCLKSRYQVILSAWECEVLIALLLKNNPLGCSVMLLDE